jgi:hypothetical protein
MGPIRPPVLCVLGVKRPASSTEVKGEWKCASILLSGFMITYEHFLHFYSATGCIYCADVCLLFQNSLELMFYCV